MKFILEDTDDTFYVKLAAEGETNEEKSISLTAAFATCFAMYPHIAKAAYYALAILNEPESDAYKEIKDKADFILKNRE